MATLEAFLARTLTDPTRALFHLIKRRYANKDVESVTVFREVTTTHPEWARITRPPAFNPLTTPCPPPYEEYIPPTWLWNDFAFNAVWYGFILAFLLLVLWLLWNPGLPCFLGSGPGNGGPVGPGGSGGSAPGGSGPNGNGGPSGSNPGGSGAPGGSGTNGNGNGGDTGPPHAPPSAPSDPSGGFGTGGDNGSNSSPLPSGPPPPPSAPGNPSAPMNLRVPPSGDPGTSGGSGNGSVNGSSLPPAHPSFIPYNGFTPGSAPGNPTSSLPPASAPITASPAPASVSAAAHTDSFADWWIIYTIVIVLGFAIGCTSYEIPWTFAEPALASLLAVNKVHCMLFLLTHGYHLRGWYMSSLRTNYEYLTDWHHRQYHQYINEFVWKVICGKRWLVFYVPIFLSWLGDLAVEKWPFVRRFLVRVWRFICPLLQKFFTLLWDLLKLGVHNVILLYRDWRNIYGPTTEDHNAVLNENARLEKKNARLEKKNAQLQQNNGQIEERNARLEKTMHEQDQIIVQKNRKIVAQRDTIKAGRNFDQEKELDKRGVLAKALKVENSALKEQVAEANEDNSALREKVAELEVKVQKLRDESATVKTLQAAYHRLETRRDDQVQNDVEGHPVVKELRAKLQESNTQLDAAGQTEAESKSTTKALEASNQQLQAQLNAAGQTEAETQSTVKALETSNQQLQAQISADRKSALDFIQPLEHENKSLTHQLAVANLSLTFSNGETERLRGQLEAGEKARGMMSREMNELRKTMAQLQTQAQGPLPPSQPEGPLPPSQPEEPLPQTQPEVPQPEAQSPRKMAKPVGHRKRLVRPSDVPEQPPQVPSGQTNPIPVVDPVPSQGPDDTNLGPGTKPVPGVDPVPVVDPQADPPRKQKPPSGRRPRPAPKPVKPLPDPTPLSGPDPVPDPRPVPNPPAGPDPLPGQKPLPDPTPLFGPISLPGSNPPPAPTPPAGSNSLPGQKRLPGLSGFPGSIPLPVNTPLPAQNIPGPRTENPQSSTGPLSDPMDVNEDTRPTDNEAGQEPGSAPMEGVQNHGSTQPSQSNVGTGANTGHGGATPVNGGRGSDQGEGKTPAEEENIQQQRLEAKQRIYRRMFPHTHELLPADKRKFESSFTALVESLRFQHGLTATVEDLVDVYNSNRQDMDRLWFSGSIPGHDILSNLQMNKLMELWGERHNLKLRAVIFVKAAGQQLSRTLEEEWDNELELPDTKAVWLFRNRQKVMKNAEPWWRGVKAREAPPKDGDEGKKPVSSDDSKGNGDGGDGGKKPGSSDDNKDGAGKGSGGSLPPAGQKPSGDNEPSDDGKEPAGSSKPNGADKKTKQIDDEDRFEVAFPYGYQVIPTKNTGFLCGYYAVIETIKAMHTDVTPPTVKELDGVFNSDVIQETFRSALVEGEELNTNFFTADQMAAILAQWGSARGLQINLGYIKRNLSTTEGPRYAKPVVLDGQKGHDLRSIDVWVEHNGRDDGAAHWSAKIVSKLPHTDVVQTIGDLSKTIYPKILKPSNPMMHPRILMTVEEPNDPMSSEQIPRVRMGEIDSVPHKLAFCQPSNSPPLTTCAGIAFMASDGCLSLKTLLTNFSTNQSSIRFHTIKIPPETTSENTRAGTALVASDGCFPPPS